MPTVTFRGVEVECSEGAVLRDVLLDAGLSPHNGAADRLNCRGNGTCGTCAVEISADPGSNGPEDAGGDAPAVSERGLVERGRLAVPPHTPESGLRLACQTRVYRDVTVTKHPGFWGHRVGEE
jgi:ferredoxin